MTYIDEESGKEFETLDEMIASWPEPTFWEKVWYKIRRLKDIPWWFKHRLVPKHRYHVAKTKPFLKPGYCDPMLRIQVVIFEETYSFIEWQKRQGYWKPSTMTEADFRKEWDDDEHVKGSLKWQEEENIAMKELEEVADWWALRRKTGDFYLPETYEGNISEYSEKMRKVDQEIDENVQKVVRNLHRLWD